MRNSVLWAGLLATVIHLSPAAETAPPPVAADFELTTLRSALIPKREVGADTFLAEHPTYDGRGVVIAIFDTGVDPRAPGLAVTSTGERKVLDIIDGTGSGDVDTSTVVQATAEHTLAGQSGRTLTLPADLINPTGDFRLGLKRGDELFAGNVYRRLTDDDATHWDAAVSTRRATPARQPSAALRAARAKAPVDRTRAELDLIARAEVLEHLEDAYAKNSPGPVYDCVLWHDGTDWNVLVDTDRDADLRDETRLRPYPVAGETGVFDDVTHATFGVQVYEEGNLLSIVTVSGTHGTHVAAIAAAHFPEEPARAGIAPGARIVSIKIGDIRTGGSSYGVSERRALAAAARHKVDIVNASWGGGAVYQDGDDANGRLYRALVERYDILAVLSAGNNGPALSTSGSAGGDTSRLLGVGAYVSPEMGRVLYNTLADHPSSAAGFAFTSRGPTKDGDRSVDVMAPGAAWASYSAESLTGAEMINGTSMASPSAAGVAALVLSAAKQANLDAAPARLRSALMLGTTPVPAEDELTAGTGLVSAPGAWAKLQAVQGIPAFNTFYDFAVTGGTFTASGRGLYVREAVTQPRRRVTARITPAWTESVSNETRYAFEADFELRPADPWIAAPDYLHLANGDQTITLHLDLPKQPGLLTSRIDAFLVGHADLGPVFSIPITVVQPAPADAFVERRLATQIELQPAETKRLFFSAPASATQLRLRLTHVATGDPVPRRFVIHGLTLAAQSENSRFESVNYLWLKAGEERVIDIPVKAGAVTEVAFNQYFYTTAPSQLAAEFEWIGLGLPASASTVIEPNLGWAQLEFNPATDRTVAVKAQLTHAVRVVLPKTTERLALDERAELPQSPRTPGPARPPVLRQTFEIEFEKATKAALADGTDYDLSERIGGGRLFVVHESGEILADRFGGARRVISFPKGKTTVIREFTTTDFDVLDFAENLPLQIVTPLKDKATLPLSAGVRAALEGDTVEKLNLAPGREEILFIKDTAADTLADLKPAPAYVTGEVTFKDTEDRELAQHPLIYLVGASPKKAVNADAKPKPAKDPRPPVEKLQDTIYDARLAYIRDERKNDDATTQANRAELIALLRAERPGDPAPIFEQALDTALAARLASDFWGKLGRPGANDKKEAEADTADADAPKPAEKTPPPPPDLTQVDAVLALLDEAHAAAEPDAVSTFFGATPVAAPGDIEARHALEHQKEDMEDARKLLARIARLRADVLRAADRGADAWAAFTEIARWESDPAKETRRLEAALYRHDDLLGLALQALNKRIEDDPYDADLLKERIALYRELGWTEFAEQAELTLALRTQQQKRIKS